jgi:hypothetical protein
LGPGSSKASCSLNPLIKRTFTSAECVASPQKPLVHLNWHCQIQQHSSNVFLILAEHFDPVAAIDSLQDFEACCLDHPRRHGPDAWIVVHDENSAAGTPMGGHVRCGA